jgi:hypothetical protein
VAEHHVDRTDGGFEARGAGEKIVEDAEMAAAPSRKLCP